MGPDGIGSLSVPSVPVGNDAPLSGAGPNGPVDPVAHPEPLGNRLSPAVGPDLVPGPAEVVGLPGPPIVVADLKPSLPDVAGSGRGPGGASPPGLERRAVVPKPGTALLLRVGLVWLAACGRSRWL